MTALGLHGRPGRRQGRRPAARHRQDRAAGRAVTGPAVVQGGAGLQAPGSSSQGLPEPVPPLCTHPSCPQVYDLWGQNQENVTPSSRDVGGAGVGKATT